MHSPCLWTLHNNNFNLARHPQLTDYVTKCFAFHLLATRQQTYAAFGMKTAWLHEQEGSEKYRKWLQWEARFFSSFIQSRQTPKVQVNKAVVVFFFISIFFIEYARIAVDKGILTAANLWCKKTHFGLIKCSISWQATVPTLDCRKTGQGMQKCSADTIACIDDARTDARHKGVAISQCKS